MKYFHTLDRPEQAVEYDGYNGDYIDEPEPPTE